MGIEDYYGWVGSEYSYNSPSLSDSLAIVFELGPIGFGSSQSYTGYPGDTLTYELTITNNRLVDDLFDFTFVSTYGWTAVVCDEYCVPLADSDGDLDPDTGVMASGASMYRHRAGDHPSQPHGRGWRTPRSWRTSDLDTSDTAQVTLVSEVVTAMFAPPHSDYGDDSESDGLYDYLVVDVSVRCALRRDLLHLRRSLRLPRGTTSTGLSAANSSHAGSYIVSFYFDGPTIFAFGTDGVYYVDLYLWDRTSIIGLRLPHDLPRTCAPSSSPPSRTSTRRTPTRGTTPGRTDCTTFSWWTLGSRRRSKGHTRIDANLYDVWGMTYVTSVSYDVYLMVGWQIVQLQFDGEQLYAHGA